MPFMILGAAVTWYFSPAIQYRGGANLSLEKLDKRIYEDRDVWLKWDLGKDPDADHSEYELREN
jgi:hypothetical protein